LKILFRRRWNGYFSMDGRETSIRVERDASNGLTPVEIVIMSRR
jgi:hypothetical protein